MFHMKHLFIPGMAHTQKATYCRLVKFSYGADSQSRTGTSVAHHPLKVARLPIPPYRQILNYSGISLISDSILTGEIIGISEGVTCSMMLVSSLSALTSLVAK